MKPRRRRWFREETLAPWITIAVILSLWWGGSWLFNRGAAGDPIATEAPVTAPATSDARTTDPSPTPAPDATSASGSSAQDPPSVGSDAAFAAASTASDADGGAAVVPVLGIDAATLTSTFNEARGGGLRRHEAMDILAPRGTPVVAAVNGRVVKLFTSAAGGLTVYQFDEAERYCYYYAHLDAYAPDLTEGQVVQRGQVIGSVGTTGNAPPNTPHLHFAIFRLGPEKKWWEGEPVDPITFIR